MSLVNVMLAAHHRITTQSVDSDSPGSTPLASNQQPCHHHKPSRELMRPIELHSSTIRSRTRFALSLNRRYQAKIASRSRDPCHQHTRAPTD
jgi:hypothetical protein